MDNDDLTGTLVLLCVYSLISVCVGFGTYKYGRFVERKALTEALSNQVESIYMQGQEAGFMAGRVQGYAQGETQCDHEELPSGHY